MRAISARVLSFLRELRQRRVDQTAAVYAASVFVALQAADLLVEAFGLQTWVLTLLVVLALLGLPVVLALAWTFDLTTHGIRRTVSVADTAGATDGVRVEPAAPMPGSRARMLFSGVLLVLLGAGSFAAWARIGPGSGARPVALAVLPFMNIGGAADDEYLCDGLTEDVLTQLAGVAGLRVTSRTSVMQYKGTTTGTRAIAAELGVTHVLEGSVRRADGRLRITAQLIDARTDRHLWAESYDRVASNLLEVQSDLAGRITTALRVRLSPEELQRIGSVPTADTAAYDLYMRARQQLYRYDREANEVAIELAQRATRLDPEFAPAHALLGTAFAVKNRLGEGPEWGDSAMVAAQRAITLDPNLAEGHLAMGNAYLRLGRYPAALRSYERAAALNPSDWRSLVNTAVLHAYQGRPLEALRWTRRAITVDPRSPQIGIAHQNIASYYLDLSLPDLAAQAVTRARETQPPDHPQLLTYEISIALQRGDHAAARATAELLVTAAPTDASAQLAAGDAYLFSGDAARARIHYRRAYAMSPRAEGIRHFAPALLGYVHRQYGERLAAERLFAELDALAQDEIARGHDNYTVYFSLAGVSAVRGETERALSYLEQAVESGGVSMEWAVLHDPLLESVRRQPRYLDLSANLTARGEAMRREALRDRL
jgi:adenylate cyclase